MAEDKKDKDKNKMATTDTLDFKVHYLQKRRKKRKEEEV